MDPAEEAHTEFNVLHKTACDKIRRMYNYGRAPAVELQPHNLAPSLKSLTPLYSSSSPSLKG